MDGEKGITLNKERLCVEVKEIHSIPLFSAFPNGSQQKINEDLLYVFVLPRTRPHVACTSILPGHGSYFQVLTHTHNIK